MAKGRRPRRTLSWRRREEKFEERGNGPLRLTMSNTTVGLRRMKSENFLGLALGNC